MAVTIIRYPGGLEYPEFWKNNIRGLTPTSSYTLSFDQALNKFPGLEYDAQFNALKNSTQSQETAPTAPASYIDIKVADPATSEPQSIENFTNKLLDQAKGEAVTWPSISPEIEENLEIVREQAATDNVDSKQFLDSYVAGSEPAVAQNQGPSTPVKYDEGMKQYVPNPGAGRPGEVRLKNPPAPLAQGPRGEYVNEAEAPGFGPRGETVVAQALSSGPRGMDRPPGTYHPSNIMPLITPGSRFSDKEGYMIQDPFKNSPQTGPGLSERESRAVNVAIRTADEQKALQAFQSEYDPQKARTATIAAKEYKKQSQAEDPFRSSAFG
jgi:hypothetical protein